MVVSAAEGFNQALELFSSLYQDVAATDLPAGLSPDNQDVWYLPGSVQTRPALSNTLSPVAETGSDIVSITEYANPDGGFLTIWLSSLGNLWQQDPATLVKTQIGSFGETNAETQFRSVTAFDKQFFAFYNPELTSAFSDDPFCGCDVPAYFDGTNLWRVTTDNPAITPTAADVFSSLAMSNAGAYISAAISTISESGNTVTVTTATAHNLLPNQPFIAQNCATTGYNGIFTVLAVVSPTVFTYFNITSGLGAATTGGVGPAVAVTTLTVPAAGQANVGDMIAIAGNQNSLNNATAGNPMYWQVVQVGASGALLIASTQIAFSIATMPQSSAALGITVVGGGTLTVGGQSTAGPHNLVCMFQSFNGAITGPSLPLQFNSVGNSKFQVTAIPLGPPGTAARILAFTPAYGTSYFYLEPAIIPAVGVIPQYEGQGTIVFDNTSTTATVDFSDAQLASGIQIDIQGNNLFSQIVLAPCLGCIEYQGRMGWWGEINNIKNLINPGFDGGYAATISGVPPGWSNTGSTGGTVSLHSSITTTGGLACLMTSAAGAMDCLITQSAANDFYGGPTFQPNLSYYFRVFASTTSPTLSVIGTLTADLHSASTGFISTATIAVTLIDRAGSWLVAKFNNPMPAAIPSDLTLRIYLNTAPGGMPILIDDTQFIDANQPVLWNQMRLSYFGNEFGYDQITGVTGFDGPAKMTGAFVQRGYLFALTDGPMYQTQNNGSTEPNGWGFSSFADECDCFGPNAVTTTEDIAWWAGQSGFRVFSGAKPIKLSQEIEPTWESINGNSPTSVWAVNDPIQRIVYVGIPTGTATKPSLVLPMSYRSVDAAYNVPDPLHTSYSGKMIATDLCRKWTRWNIPMSCGAILTRPGLEREMYFGGQAHGNFYSLTFAKKTDDDYGQIFSYYVTYFFFNHDIEQNSPGVGLHQKVYAYLSAYITGVGTIQPTVLANNLSNPWLTSATVWDSVNQKWDVSGAPSNPLAAVPLTSGVLKYDLEWGLNIKNVERCAIKWQPSPLPGQTDSDFFLNHMVITVTEDKVTPVRGSNVG